jgi:hypothetical protein
MRPAYLEGGFSVVLVTTGRLAAHAQLLGVGILIMCTAGCASTAPEEAAGKRIDVDFSSDEAGHPPRGFTTALTGGGGPASWLVRADAGTSGPRKILVQESHDDTSYRFPLCIYNGVSARDVTVSVAFTSISGQVDQAAGIVLRYSPENYYIARANALEDNVNIFKTIKGKRTIVKEAPVKYAAGEWHVLGFTAAGTHLTVIFDGKAVLEADDEAITTPGQVGLWTKADSVSAFDRMTIEAQ